MIRTAILVTMLCALAACRDTAIEVRRHLPALAPQITLRVQSGKDVIPEIGATALAPPQIGCTGWSIPTTQ